MRKGDCLVVWKLDRLGRSLKDLIATINGIHEKKMSFLSLQESLNTGTSSGKLIFHVFGALAEFERDVIRAARKRDSCRPCTGQTWRETEEIGQEQGLHGKSSSC